MFGHGGDQGRRLALPLLLVQLSGARALEPHLASACQGAMECEPMRLLLTEHGGPEFFSFCLAVHQVSSSLLHWSWPPQQVKAVDRVLELMCTKCHSGMFQESGLFDSAIYCLTSATNYLVRLLKWALNYQLVDTLLEAAKRALPDAFKSWLSVYETPFQTNWDVDALHDFRLRPPEGGFWPLNHARLRPLVQALRQHSGQISQELELSRDAIDKMFVAGGPLNERVGWGGFGVWSQSGGWRDGVIRLLPSLRDALDALLPMSERPFPKGDVMSLQRIAPGGFLLPHNDPERVSIMMCLSGCSGAWVQMVRDRRFFEEVGGVLAFDNIIDHSAGNFGPDDRWVVNLVVCHPDVDALTGDDGRSGSAPPVAALPAPSEVERARGMLGGPSSRALLRLRAMAETFQCSEGRPGAVAPEVGRLGGELQHNTLLSMSGISWPSAEFQFHFRFLRLFVKFPVVAASAEEAKVGCQRMQGLQGRELQGRCTCKNACVSLLVAPRNPA